MSIPEDKLYSTSLHINLNDHPFDVVGDLVAAVMARYIFWAPVVRRHIDERSRHQCDLYFVRNIGSGQEHPEHLEKLEEQEHLRMIEFVRGFLAARAK